MSAAGGAYPIVPPLPEYEQRTSKDVTSGTGGGKTTQELSEVQKAALSDVDKTAEAQKAAEGEKAAQAKALAGIESQGAVAEQGVAAWKLAQLQSPAALEVDDAIARARENVKVQQARYGAMPPPKLFADGTAWDKVKLASSLFLAGISDAVRARAAILAGQGIPAHTVVGQIVDRDIERQRAAIDKLKDSVVMARTGLQDAQEARRQLRQDIDLKAIAMLDNAKKLTVARLAAQKMAQPDIDQHQAILAIDQKKGEYKADYVKGLTTPIQSKWDKSTKTGVDEVHRAPTAGAGGGGVEADKNAANFGLLREHGTWLANNMKNLTPDEAAAVSAIQSAGVALADSPKVNAALSAAGIDPETGASSRVKAYLDHMSRANDAIGRLKSGGAINKDEDVRFSGWFKLRPSDKPEDIESRANNVLTDIRILGEHLDRPARPPVAAPTAAGAPAKDGPPPAPADPKRATLIKNLKANPSWQKTKAAKAAMKQYGVTDEDLR